MDLDTKLINLSTESMTLFVHNIGSAVKIAESVHKDQIKKDNDDPMPIVRVINGLDRQCEVPLTVIMTRDKGKEKSYDFNFEGGMDSKIVHLENTRK